MPKGKTAATAVKDKEAPATDAPAAPQIEDSGQTPVPVEEVNDPRDAKIKALESSLQEALDALRQDRAPTAIEKSTDYVWPKATPEQVRRGQPLIPTARVIKVGYLTEWERFDNVNGQKSVRVSQYRMPMADGKWDIPRLEAELKKFNLAPIGDIFADAPAWCQLLNCWNLATFDGAFCHRKHREFVMESHDRRLVLE